MICIVYLPVLPTLGEPMTQVRIRNIFLSSNLHLRNVDEFMATGVHTIYFYIQYTLFLLFFYQPVKHATERSRLLLSIKHESCPKRHFLLFIFLYHYFFFYIIINSSSFFLVMSFTDLWNKVRTMSSRCLQKAIH